jgi:glycosyltransferase involved in cell wall biosynthesis
MNILVVSQYFWPEPFRINDLCDGLVDKGHNVTVLTGEPNYPEGAIYTDYLNDKSDYVKYNGCKVIRCRIIPRGKGGGIRLMLNYLSFVFTACFKVFFQLRKTKFDVVFVCQLSPATVALPAIFYKFLTKTPIVMWVLDLWPESLKEAGGINNPIILSSVGKLMNYIYSRCDLVLTQSKQFKNEILDRVNHRRVEYFPNWAEDLFSDKSSPSICKLNKKLDSLNILFAGNIGESQDFPTVVEAFKIVKQRQIKVKLHIVGDGRSLEYLKNEVKCHELNEYIEFYGRYPLEEMPSFFDFADVCLVNLKDSEAFSKTLPGKVQTYLASGKPILAALNGEGANIILESKAGLVSNSGDYTKLAENIEKMCSYSSEQLDFLGVKAKEYSDINYSRENLLNTLVEKMRSVFKKNSKESS